MPPLPRVLICTAAVVTVAALTYLAWGWSTFPLYEWNEVRLAPSFALRYGLPLYLPAHGGPLSTWLYGPVGAWLNLPATFAGTAVGAVQTAGAINLLTFTLPLLLIALTARELRGQRFRILVFALPVLALPPTALTFQVADHAAIALGLSSCWILARSHAPSSLSLGLAATLCVLSAWAKQLSVVLAVAQLLFLVSEHAVRVALRYFAWLTCCALLSIAAAALVADLPALWLNTVQIPARLPWGDLREKLAFRGLGLGGYVLLPLVGLVILRMTRFWPSESSAPARFFRCAAIAFVVLLPLGLSAVAKIGGDLNLLHSSHYLLPAAALLLTSYAAANRRATLALIVAAGALVLLRVPQLRESLRPPQTMFLAHAMQLAEERPGATWFPKNPVVTFYTDGRLYHVEDGIATRHLAGMGLRERDFRAHLPPQLGVVVYPAADSAPFALQLLTDFSRRTSRGYWALYERPEPR
jgi:hypothetical protein